MSCEPRNVAIWSPGFGRACTCRLHQGRLRKPDWYGKKKGIPSPCFFHLASSPQSSTGPEVKTTVNNLWELFMLCKTFAPISPTQGFSVGFRARTIPPMSRREFYSTIGEGVMVCLHHRYIQTTEVMLTPVSSCPVALTHTVLWIQFFSLDFGQDLLHKNALRLHMHNVE